MNKDDPVNKGSVNKGGEEYEVHVFATTDEDGYSDGLEPESTEDENQQASLKSKSSGLIRLALLGVVLVLSLFLIHKVWGPQIARLYLNEPSLKEQFAPIDPQHYSEAVDSWNVANDNLQNSLKRQKTALGQMDSSKSQIEVLVKVSELTKEAVSKGTKDQAAAEARLQRADKAFVALANSDLPAQLKAAKSDVDANKTQLRSSQARLNTAKADFAKIEKTVEQLGRATEAALAAVEASEAAVAAARSAGELIAEGEAEEAQSENSSLLARLTFNLFSESQPQISGAERALEAASIALATGEDRLIEFSEIEADRQEELNRVKIALDQAKAEELRLKALVNSLEADRITAARELKSAQGANLAAIDTLDEAKLANQQAIAKLANAREAFQVAKAKSEVAAADIKSMQAKFKVAAADLSALSKRHARRSAIVLAGINSDFSGELREKIGVSATTDPTRDRFALSSEVLFVSGKAKLGRAGMKKLDQVATVLKRVMQTIPDDVDWVLRVDGHTDSKPLSASNAFDDNWQLSQARALAVVKYLITKQAISPKYLAATGFGPYQPIRAGKTATDLAINRRIELFLTPK